MAFKGEAKRKYQREYMRRRRRSGSNRYVRPLLGAEQAQKENRMLDPCKRRITVRPDKIFGMNARRLLDYMRYLNEGGYTIEEFTHPQDNQPAFRMVALHGK